MQKTKILIIVLILLFSSVLLSSAQTVPSVSSPTKSNSNANVVVLATVNIINSRITSRSNNDLYVSFDLTNRDGIQPGVRYGIFLVKPGDGKNVPDTVVDQRIYSDTVALNSNSTVHKEVDYQAPAYLNGNFNVWVVSRNSDGMPLGQEMAGTITLNGTTSNYIELVNNTCSVKVSGESKTYDLNYGVDVKPSENLILTCQVKNHFGNSINVTPNFNTYYRSLFGDLVSTTKQSPFNLAANATQSINFTLPKANKPQAYDVLLTLTNSQGHAVSNTIDTHYVIDGPSGSIQNLRIDKNSYQKGDTAKVTLNYVQAADTFPGSRNGGTKTDGDSVEIDIASAGQTCITPFQKKITDIAVNFATVSANIPITSGCPSPIVTAILKDVNGNVLDRISFAVPKASTPANVVKPVTTAKPSLVQLILLTILIIVVILAFMIFIKQAWNSKNKRKSKSKISLFIIISAGLILFGKTVKADTFTVGPCWSTDLNHWSAATYLASINNNFFSPGGTLTANGAITGFSVCANGFGWIGSETVSFNNNNYPLLSYYNGGATSGSASGPVESVPGNYSAVFTGYCGESSTSGNYSIPYTVGGCTPGTFDPVNCRACNNGTWESNCSNYGSGTPLSDWCNCELKCEGNNNGNQQCRGVCGTANGKVYPYGTYGYGSDTQCSLGTSTNTNFPAAGATANWTCQSDGGTSNAACSASQASPNQISYSCNRCSYLKKFDQVSFQSTDQSCYNVVPSTNTVADSCNCSCQNITDPGTGIIHDTDTSWSGYSSCAASCPICGNGVCESGENCSNCSQDCGACTTCGNGVCDSGETCSTCPQDCGACPVNPVCGNGSCEVGETCATCPQDCGTCPVNPVCGNGICDSGETCSSCPQDCGACSYHCQSLCQSSDCKQQQEACLSSGGGTVNQSNCNHGSGCPIDNCTGGCGSSKYPWQEVAP